MQVFMLLLMIEDLGVPSTFQLGVDSLQIADWRELHINDDKYKTEHACT